MTGALLLLDRRHRSIGPDPGSGSARCRTAATPGRQVDVCKTRRPPQNQQAHENYRRSGPGSLIGDRPVAALLANAGHGLGQAFLDQDFDEVQHVIDTNIVGTIYLIHQIGRGMRACRSGRILITGSDAGYLPGTFHAVYNGTKAFINSFSFALRNELKDSGVSVTCLIPGATDTGFFDRAGLEGTRVGEGDKDDLPLSRRMASPR
jgi:short-subunit dehydrogenase